MALSDEHGFRVATARQVWSACARSLGHRRWRLIPLLLVLLVSAACGMVTPFVLGALVDLISAAAADPPRILLLVAIMAGAVIAGAVLSGIGIVLIARLLETMLADLREHMVDAALHLSQHRVEQAGSGDVVARAVDDVAEVAEAIPEVVPAVSGSLFTIALTIGSMAALNPWYALALLLAVPVHVYAVWRYLRTAPPVYAGERRALSMRAQSALDALYGLPTLRAYRLAAEHERRIGDASWGVVHWVVRAVTVQNAFFGRLNLAEYIGMTAILGVGFVLVGADAATIGTATTAMLLFLRLFGPINGLLFVADQAQSALASLGRIVGVSVEEPHPEADLDSGGGGLEFHGVTHRYGTGRAAVADIDLTVTPGETVAIVGASGAGKSTLAALAAGIHVPASGTVHRPVDIALVTQEVHVFDGTVRDNLTLAAPDADDRRITRALADVGALDAVAALEHGLDTHIGAGGAPLDAAVAQLLALARVRLRKPAVVILDEATAEAGSRHANALDGAARAAIADRTALIVTHRLSQLAGADRIVVLDDGRIVESGTHDDLVTAGGVYARLWAHGAAF